MCSSRGVCRGEDRGAAGSVSSSGSQYALCALGVGLVALGVVMIVWSVVPAESLGNSSSGGTSSEGSETEMDARGKTSSVAFVLVGAGVAMLLLAICLSVRNKRRDAQRDAQGTDSVYRAPGEPGETEADPLPSYDVPSYYDAVGSGQYPVRQSNLRNSTSQLPSYEDLIEAVENEGAAGAGQEPAQPVPAAEAPQPTPEPPAVSPTRHSTRSGRLLRPLRVRRIKSDKLHLKDFRLNLRNTGPVTIEPLTPPPQYDDKAPEFGESLPQAEP